MKIQFYSSNYPVNQLDKSSSPTVGSVLTGTLREGTSITDPVILIDVSQMTEDDSVLYANYAYIEDFQRYYFVTGITLVRNTLYSFSFHVDVLTSNASLIKQKQAMIGRRANGGNPLIPDSNAVFEARDSVYEYTPDNLSTVTHFGGQSTFNIALTWFAEHPVHANQTGITPTFDYHNLPADSDNVLPSVEWYNASARQLKMWTAVLTRSNAEDLFAQIWEDQNILNYLVSCVIFPYDIGSVDVPSGATLPDAWSFMFENAGSLTENKYFDGSFPAFEADGKFYYTPISPRLLIADFSTSQVATGSHFYDFDPYAKFELYLPYYGWVQLPCHECLNSRLKVYYTPDWQTGKALIQIVNATSYHLVWFGDCQLGREVPVTSTNQDQRKISIALNAIQFGLNVAGNTGISVANLSMNTAMFEKDRYKELTAGLGVDPSSDAAFSLYQASNVRQASSMATSIAGSASSLISSAFTPITVTGVQPTDDTALYQPQTVRVRYSSKRVHGIDETFAGLPSGELAVIGDCSGFITCDGFFTGQLNQAGNMTLPETEELDRLLHEGIIV